MLYNIMHAVSEMLLSALTRNVGHEQILQQRFHENPALAASESGRLSLVDHIVDDDYAPSTSSSLSPGKRITPPKV